jgi:hypothetical protein
VAARVAELPPVGSLFAAFLGENPVRLLLAPTGALNRIPARNAAVLTGRDFFPRLISQPFHHGLVVVFATAMVLLVIAAGASLLRGGKYIHEDQPASAARDAGPGPVSSPQPAGQGSGRSARRPQGHG